MTRFYVDSGTRMRGETCDEARARHDAQHATGCALAEESFERGRRRTDDENAAVGHWMRWGCDGYPIRKIGKRWVIETAAVKDGRLFATLREVVGAWETYLELWLRLGGLESQERALAERAS
jgi:hypothetical protein